MTFLQRNALIEGLTARGFVPGKEDTTGWRYQHTEDGFFLRFNANGGFTLDLPSGSRKMGVVKDPAEILDMIDKEAEAL